MDKTNKDHLNDNLLENLHIQPIDQNYITVSRFSNVQNQDS